LIFLQGFLCSSCSHGTNRMGVISISQKHSRDIAKFKQNRPLGQTSFLAPDLVNVSVVPGDELKGFVTQEDGE